MGRKEETLSENATKGEVTGGRDLGGRGGGAFYRLAGEDTEMTVRAPGLLISKDSQREKIS